MGDANTPQQGPSADTRKTFYVLRNTTWGRGEFTKVLKSGGPSSLPRHTVDDATPYSTLADAVAAQKTAVALGFGSYEIVMVSRSVTKGVLKSPAKTVRRVLTAHEKAPQNVRYGVGYRANILAALHIVTKDTAWGASYNLDNAILHTTEARALKHLQDMARAENFSWENAQIVRVVEETVPEVRTEDVVKDILTPLP